MLKFQDGLSMMVIAVVYRPNLHRLKDLIEQGADINQIYQGSSLLEHSIKNGKAEIARVLINAGAKYEKLSLLEYAVKEKNAAIIDIIISFWGDLNVSYMDEYPIIYAINTGNLELVKVLKARGARLDKVLKHVSISLNDIKIAESCMEAGGDPNGKHNGLHVLTHAIKNGNDKLAKLLKKYGAKLELTLNEDKFKIAWDDFKVAQAFIEAGGA